MPAKNNQHTDGYIGLFPIEDLDRLRKYYKSIGLSVRFRGRGKRVGLENHEHDYNFGWNCDLPLQYAERVAIYER